MIPISFFNLFSTTTPEPNTFAARLKKTNFDQFFSPNGMQEFHKEADNSQDSSRITQFFQGTFKPVIRRDSWNWVNRLKRLFPTQATKEVNFRRQWDAETKQVRFLNDRAATSQLPPHTPSFFDTLDTVALVCHEFTSGQALLKSLAERSVPLNKCDLELTDSGPQGETTKKYNVEEILTGGSSRSLTDAQRVQLTTFLRYLVTGEYSYAKAKNLLGNKDFQVLMPAFELEGLGVLGPHSMGGHPFTDFHATTPASAIALSLQHPSQETQKGSNSYTLITDCGVTPTSSGSRKLASKCGHFLEVDGVEYFLSQFNHHTSEKTIVRALPEVVNNWHMAFNQQGLTSSYFTEVDGALDVGTTYHTLASRLPGISSFSIPKSSNVAPNFLIPAGMIITAAGLSYAKATFDSTKSNLRKVVGCATGIAAAIFGMTLSSIPFGSFKRR